jgi:hypothetical protein
MISSLVLSSMARINDRSLEPRPGRDTAIQLYPEDVSQSDAMEKGLETLSLLTATEVAAEPSSRHPMVGDQHNVLLSTASAYVAYALPDR